MKIGAFTHPHSATNYITICIAMSNRTLVIEHLLTVNLIMYKHRVISNVMYNKFNKFQKMLITLKLTMFFNKPNNFPLYKISNFEHSISTFNGHAFMIKWVYLLEVWKSVLNICHSCKWNKTLPILLWIFSAYI